jgi:starch synthase (maltosyl-transferring)
VSKIRVVIESIAPQVDGGRFPVKRVVGESVTVEADVFADGHDAVAARILYRHESAKEWQSVTMSPLGNDRWTGRFTVRSPGRYLFTVTGWVDHLETRQRGLIKKHEAGLDIETDLKQVAALAREAAARAPGVEAQRLAEWASLLCEPGLTSEAKVALAQSATPLKLARQYPDPEIVLQHSPPLAIDVDRERARCSAWYEMFPRSAGARGQHGRLSDVEAQLPYVASMGFDVLYLPPIHPIGTTHRKGPNNRPRPQPSDPGSPWAIGSSEGGHKAVHPALGTREDLRRLVSRAAEHGIEIALDIAFQCSPDHPYVRAHPEWFLKRPDGSIQHAENPPKQYEDIYPFYFETPAWESLWSELKSIIELWIEDGVRIFRVDNPHTKPFAFWEWAIREIRRSRPDVIFLAEAFTRPKVMYRLAKCGFSQSYSYFPWRNSKDELTQYFTELTSPPLSELFRGSHWPNTPDILTEYLQLGGRAAFAVRLVLAATLGASYGIYGPAFELMEQRALEPGSEEYRDSEKYQVRAWDKDQPGSLRELIAKVNRARRENIPLQSDAGLTFHALDNESLIAYSKAGEQGSDAVLIIANLDPHHTQSGWVQLDLAVLGVAPGTTFQVHDLLTDERYLWRDARNYVSLDPQRLPAHILRIRRRVRTEKDFDYFM